ncbi:hypothetical protein AAFF_G00360140 [Aldrovandia affinis]|uniref:Uncharacterized protein n=1 Tax=Aldrovandia affinis TaxID=143900 RepID=A0AAD7SIU9_9TELE|nr:hypothetical protein AAFF_G00360140 [Aldrovandia affinis]
MYGIRRRGEGAQSQPCTSHFGFIAVVIQRRKSSFVGLTVSTAADRGVLQTGDLLAMTQQRRFLGLFFSSPRQICVPAPCDTFGSSSPRRALSTPSNSAPSDVRPSRRAD